MNAEQRKERAALLRRAVTAMRYVAAVNARSAAKLADMGHGVVALFSGMNAWADSDATALEAIAAEYETNDPATWSPAMVKWGMNQLRALGEILGIRDTMTDAEALQHVRDVVARAGASR